MKSQHALTLDDARRVVDAVRKVLEGKNQGAAVAVVDEHGELMAFVRTEGCPLASINNSIHKAFTAARERRPSFEVGEASRTDPFPMTNFGDLRYTAWGGGVPLLHNGQVVGAVGVSGLPEKIDMELAAIGAAAL